MTFKAGDVEVEIRGRRDALKADLAAAEADVKAFDAGTVQSAKAAARARVQEIKAALKEEETALKAAVRTREAAEKASQRAAEATARAQAKVAADSARAAKQAADAKEREATRAAQAQKRRDDAEAAAAQKAADNLIRQQERAQAAIDKARAKIAADQSQASFNSTLGVSRGPTKSASSSAAVFQAAFAEQEAQAKAVASAQAEATKQTNALGRAIEAAARGEMQLQEQANRLLAEFDPMVAAQLRMNSAIKQANTLRQQGLITAESEEKVIAGSTAQYQRFLKSQKSSAAGQLGQHQLTNLSYQANDVLTGIFSGQPLGQIAAQQGGQIFQILQSGSKGFMGSLAALVTPLNLTIAGVGALAAGAALVAVQMHKGAEQVIDFNNSLKIFGGTSGLSTENILAQTKAIAENAQVSISSVRDLGLAIVRTGQVGKDAFAPLVEGSTLLAKATGEKAVDAFTTFKPLLGDTTAAAIELNQQFHSLSGEQIKQIQLLQEQGDKTAAVKMVMDSINGTLKDQQQNLGALETWWRELNVELGKAKELLLGIGRASVQATGVDAENAAMGRLKSARDALQQKRDNPVAYALTSGDRTQFSENDQGVLDSLNKQIALYDQMKGSYGSLIERAQARKKIEEDAAEVEITSVKNGAQIREKKEQIAKVEKAIKEHVGDQVAHQKTLVDLNKQLEKLQKPDADPNARRVASLKREEDALKANISETWNLADATQRSGAEAIKLEADRRGAVEATRKGIALSTRQQLELNLAVAQAAVGAAQMVRQTGEQIAMQIKYNEAVRSGQMTREQANEAMSIDNEVKPLEDALEALQKLTDPTSIERAKKLADMIDRIRNNKQALFDIGADTALQSENKQQADQNKLLQAQLDLMEKTNRERLVSIARIQAEQEWAAKYENRGFSQSEKNAFIQGRVDAANTQASSDFRSSDQGNRNAGIGAANDISLSAGKTQKDLTEQYEAGLARIKEIEDERVRAAEGSEEKIAEAHRKAAEDTAKFDAMYQNKRLEATSDFFGSLAQLTQSSNTKLHEIGKAAAIIQATISTYQAINAALASAPFPYNIPAVAMATVEGFANVAAIEGMATGGIVKGYGGPTEDNQTRNLSVGEGVITAQGVRNNPGLVEHVNQGGKVADMVSVPSSRIAAARAAANDGMVSGGGLKIDLGVSFDNDGEFKSYVKNVSRTEATNVSQNAVKRFSADVLPKRMKQINAQPRVIGGRK